MDDSDITLHCFYTDDLEPMLIRFLSGLRDIRSVNPVKLSRQFLASGGGGRVGGGLAMWRFKTEMLARLADPAVNSPDRIHYISDIDMAIYGNIAPQTRSLLKRNDLLFQMEGSPTQISVNLGVIAFRPSAVVKEFWLTVLERITTQKLWDQDAVNRLVQDRDYIRDSKLRYGFFPNSFWARSQGEEAAAIGKAVLHHANWATSLREKWDQLNEFRARFEKDRRNHDAAFALCVESLSRLSWTYGNMNTQSVFGEMRVQADGTVIGYRHPNEARLVVGERCLRMLSDAGVCTTVFDEFYFDPFRNALLCVGGNPDDRIDMRYLLGRVGQGASPRLPESAAIHRNPANQPQESTMTDEERGDMILDALELSLNNSAEAARVLYTLADTFDPTSSLRYFSLLDNIKHIRVTVATAEDDVWQGAHLGFRVTFDELLHITIVLPRFFATGEGVRRFMEQRSASLPHILGRMRLTAFHVCDMILTARSRLMDGVKEQFSGLPKYLYFRTSWEDSCRDPGVVTYSRDIGSSNLLISDVYYYGNDSYDAHKQRVATSARPWTSRKDVVFWRGATTGAAFTANDLERNERIRLAAYCAPYPELFDVKISHVTQVSEPEAQLVGHRLRERGLFAKGVAMNVFAEYKFSVHIDGNASAASFFEKMALGCCILRVPSRFEQWFEPRITPWVHFVPLEPDYADLLDKVTFLIRNPLLAERIAMAGYRFAVEADYPHDAHVFCDDLIGSIGRHPVVRYERPETQVLMARLTAPSEDGTVSANGAQCLLQEWHDIQDERGFPYRWTKASQVTWTIPGPFQPQTTLKVEIPFLGEIQNGFAAASQLLIAGDLRPGFLLGQSLVAEMPIDETFDGRIGLITPSPRSPNELAIGPDGRPLGLSIPVEV